MKIDRLFLLGLVCFFLTTSTSISSTKEEKHGPDIEMGGPPAITSAMQPVRTEEVRVDVNHGEGIKPKHSMFSPLCKTITGSVLSLSGYVLMGAGGIVVAESPQSVTLSTVLLGVGGAAKQAGAKFLNSAQENAAHLTQELDDHVMLARTGSLSPDEMEELSDEFFGKSKIYEQLYLKHALCLDNTFATICSLVSLPLGLVGFGFTMSGDTTVGPTLIAAGVGVRDLGGWFKSRAEALSTQKKRIEAMHKLRKASVQEADAR
ncbi:MAG: hypothetical protein K2Q34_04090 [Alphaproteobacteria bacterium]|nr:hypothetical protein [Alphaproteobacteria bacterium]